MANFHRRPRALGYVWRANPRRLVVQNPGAVVDRWGYIVPLCTVAQAKEGTPEPQAPKMLCETCWEVLTDDVLSGNCTLTGQEEACCPRCWPLLTKESDGTLSRRRWDIAIARNKAYTVLWEAEHPGVMDIVRRNEEQRDREACNG